jgi:glycosyltransferase involved in cell wall biosynthesis
METQVRKKVLFLITKSNWGGAQRYVYDLANHLNLAEFEPVIVCGGEGQLVEMLNNAGIRTITLTTLERDISLKKDWAFVKELWQILKTERPQVFHVNSSKAGAVGTILGRFARVPRVIFTSHGWAFNEDRPFWQRIVIKFVHWLTVLFSHKTIAVSSAIMRQMNWPLTARKMRIIHPGRTVGPTYERKEAREKICDFFPSLSPHLAHPWLVCIAELHPIKRHQVLISALPEILKKHPNLRLICIGEGQERAKLEKLISHLHLEDKVFLVGALPEAARFLKCFDALALISKSEAYGYVIAEAGLAGLPVVATGVGGIPDIITHKKSGLLIPPDNIPAAAGAISKLFSEPKLAKKLAKELNVVVSSRTIEKMVRDTTIWY